MLEFKSFKLKLEKALWSLVDADSFEKFTMQLLNGVTRLIFLVRGLITMAIAMYFVTQDDFIMFAMQRRSSVAGVRVDGLCNGANNYSRKIIRKFKN